MHFSYPKGMYLTFTGRHWSKTDGLLDLPPPPPILEWLLLRATNLPPSPDLIKLHGQDNPDLQARLPLLEEDRHPFPSWATAAYKGSPGKHVPQRPPGPATAPPSRRLQVRLHCLAPKSKAGSCKQETATKAVANKVLNGASNFPFHLSCSTHQRIGWTAQWCVSPLGGRHLLEICPGAET
jgi:hypothetical protein